MVLCCMHSRFFAAGILYTDLETLVYYTTDEMAFHSSAQLSLLLGQVIPLSTCMHYV